jgi:hypothetical protein
MNTPHLDAIIAAIEAALAPQPKDMKESVKEFLKADRGAFLDIVTQETGLFDPNDVNLGDLMDNYNGWDSDAVIDYIVEMQGESMLEGLIEQNRLGDTLNIILRDHDAEEVLQYLVDNSYLKVVTTAAINSVIETLRGLTS